MSFDSLRQVYRPGDVCVLFIGESPPVGKTFFYAANSHLFRYTREAFLKVYGAACGDGDRFLRFFQSLGGYLVDLCDEPVNDLPQQARKSKRNEGIRPLARRIKEANPRAIVVVMKAIQKHVQQSVDLASANDLFIYYLPFPAQGHQQQYIHELAATLRQLKRKDILS